MQENFTSSSLNKQALAPFVCPDFSFAHEENVSFLLSWIYFPGGGGARAAPFSPYFTFQRSTTEVLSQEWEQVSLGKAGFIQ